MASASEEQARVHYELMRARAKRCPGCAPGYGTGQQCRHHWLVMRPDAQLRQRMDAKMRRAVRTVEETLKAAYSQPIGEIIGLNRYLRMRGL